MQSKSELVRTAVANRSLPQSWCHRNEPAATSSGHTAEWRWGASRRDSAARWYQLL